MSRTEGEGDILIFVRIPLVSALVSASHFLVWTSSLILIKFSWLYNWDIRKNWLVFSNLDLIFKVTAVEKLKIHSGGGGVCGEGGDGRASVFSKNTVTEKKNMFGVAKETAK